MSGGVDEVDLDLDDERSTETLLASLRRLVNEGRSRMDELADGLGLSAVDTERLVRVAEKRGDVRRAGYTGRSLYTVRLTEQGKKSLSALSGREAALAEHRLNGLDYAVLSVVAEEGRCTASTVRSRLDEPPSPTGLIPVLTHLVREGYLDESGLLRRYVTVTDAGEGVLSTLDAETDI